MAALPVVKQQLQGVNDTLAEVRLRKYQAKEGGALNSAASSKKELKT